MLFVVGPAQDMNLRKQKPNGISEIHAQCQECYKVVPGEMHHGILRVKPHDPKSGDLLKSIRGSCRGARNFNAADPQTFLVM